MKIIIQLTFILVLSVAYSYAQDVNKKVERIENRIEKLESKLENKRDSIELVVKVSNISSNKGVVRVHIYDDANSAFDEDMAVAGAILNAQEGEIKSTFTLKPGRYAIVAFHDENNNGFLDTNFLGIAKEKFGLSGGTERPDYKKAEIGIRRSQMIIIKLK